jgi:FSR family fosmidomycin resistance protein-like MFS transporter
VAYTPLRFADDLVYSSRVLFVILFGQAIGTFLGGVVSDRVGRRPIIIATMVALVPQVYLFHSLSGPGLLVVAASTGITMGATIPVTLVAAQELLPRNVGVASGLMMGFAFGLGGVGVAGIGALADQVGLGAALSLLTIAPLLGAVVAATCPITARRSPASTQSAGLPTSSQG